MRRDETSAAAPGTRVPSEHGEMLLALSNAVVRIHKQFHGKGPTKARSYLAQDLATVVLEGGFTRSEQTLHDRGYHRTVREMRAALQGAIEGELRAVVTDITGRSVRSFMSASDHAAQLQVEIFVLDPVDAPRTTVSG